MTRAELLDDGDLGEHRQREAAEPARHVDAGETELEGEAFDGACATPSGIRPSFISASTSKGISSLLDKGAAHASRQCTAAAGRAKEEPPSPAASLLMRGLRAFRREMLREEGGEAGKHGLQLPRG